MPFAQRTNRRGSDIQPNRCARQSHLSHWLRRSSLWLHRAIHAELLSAIVEDDQSIEQLDLARLLLRSRKPAPGRTPGEIFGRGGTMNRRELLKTSAALGLAAVVPGRAISKILSASGPSAAAGPASAVAGLKAYVCPPWGQPCAKLTFDHPGRFPSCGM